MSDYEDEPYEQEDFHYLDDDEYDRVIAGEFDAHGRIRSGPPVGAWVILIIVILLVLTLLLTR